MKRCFGNCLAGLFCREYFFTRRRFNVIALGFFALLNTQYAYRHQINNLPMALWWAIITVTTVGYGDVVPQSVAGKIIASFSLLFGVLVILILSIFILNRDVVFNDISCCRCLSLLLVISFKSNTSKTCS